MKVLVAGAGGLVGRAIITRLGRGHEVLGLSRSELDVTDRDAVFRVVRRERPGLVVGAAVVGVDASESHPARAEAINARAPRLLAEAAAEVGARVLHFSTNYVFDGDRRAGPPYTNEDAPCPINTYGRTKLRGEEAVRVACPQSFIVRTSWVFGPGKESFIGMVARQLAAGRPVRAVTDVKANATYVEDLAVRVAEILDHGQAGTYHVVNRGVCSWLDVALEAAKLLALSEARTRDLIQPLREESMRRLAARPRHAPMRCLVSERLGLLPMRPWRAAFADYLGRTRP